MSLRPTIIFPVSLEDPLLVKEAGGHISAFHDEIHKGQSFDVIVPGQMVRFYSHALPKMRESEKLAAARFAIEDRTGASLDGQHIAFGAGSDARIAVIESAALTSVINQLNSKNVDVGDIYADFDWTTPQETPLKLEDRIIFAGAEGYTIDPEWADKDLSKAPISNWDSLRTHDAKLSLRQGQFSRRNAMALPFRSLSKIAALLAITGVSWLVLQGAEIRAVTAQAQDLKTQTAALYTQATGQAAPANPALAVTRAIKSAPTANADFLPLLAGLNAALLQTENIAVQSLSYDRNKTQLSLRLIYPSFEGAGELEQAAARAGGRFRPGGVREQNGILIGDATFEIGGPS